MPVMRILYVIEGIAVKGGLERILSDKMNALCAIPDVEVVLLTVWKGMDVPAYSLDPRITHYSLEVPKPDGRLQFLFSLARILVRYKHMVTGIRPDAVVFFRAVGAFLLGYATHPCHTIFESHGIRYSNNHLWLYPRMERRVDSIVCLTNADADEYRKSLSRMGQPVGKVHVIPNFTVISRAGQPDYENKHCIFIGRYCPEKNPARLVSLWGRLHTTHPDWTLDIYGAGWPEADQSIEKNGAVVVHGRVDDMAAVMQKGSMLLLTSRTEGMPMSVLEAMRCGLPVVSVDCKCGPSDLIDDGVSGYCTPYDSDEAFIQAAGRLMDDAGLRRRMGMNAAERSVLFDKDAIIQRWIELFREESSHAHT